jgi:hypothetical protein
MSVDAHDDLARVDPPPGRQVRVHAEHECAVLGDVHVVAEQAQCHRGRDLLGTGHLAEVRVAPNGIGDVEGIDL